MYIACSRRRGGVRRGRRRGRGRQQASIVLIFVLRFCEIFYNVPPWGPVRKHFIFYILNIYVCTWLVRTVPIRRPPPPTCPWRGPGAGAVPSPPGPPPPHPLPRQVASPRPAPPPAPLEAVTLRGAGRSRLRALRIVPLSTSRTGG